MNPALGLFAITLWFQSVSGCHGIKVYFHLNLSDGTIQPSSEQRCLYLPHIRPMSLQSFWKWFCWCVLGEELLSCVSSHAAGPAPRSCCLFLAVPLRGEDPSGSSSSSEAHAAWEGSVVDIDFIRKLNRFQEKLLTTNILKSWSLFFLQLSQSPARRVSFYFIQ